jgi:hypothetical protein
MDDAQVSGAARQLAVQRWGAQKPVRLARELVQRVDELPVERRALLAALFTVSSDMVNEPPNQP